MSSCSCFCCHIGYYHYDHEETKNTKAKHEKNVAAFIYQNSGVHPESTERDSPPFHEYVGISRTHLYTLVYLIYSLLYFVCMYARTCKCIIMYT